MLINNGAYANINKADVILERTTMFVRRLNLG